jgi:pyruvate/2-oxoglutarate dehydrogenase complex dihydrolipoamide acyltransferase (E2) component
MPNLDLVRKNGISAFRKIAIGTWRTAYDPSVYGSMELRMERALAYLSEFRERTGKKATITHLFAKAAAEALRRTPDANAILRWNRLYLRKSVGVFFQVAMTEEGSDKPDLSGLTLYDVEKKSLAQICDEFQERVALVRTRKDPSLENTRSSMGRVPNLLIHWVLRFISFFLYTLNLDLRRFGLPRDPFGSVMITNIGTLGLDMAYPPLVPYSRVPILAALGAVKDAPVVERGQLAVGKVMNVSVTFDHRFIDGAHAAAMARILRAIVEDPAAHGSLLEPATEPTPTLLSDSQSSRGGD